MEYTNITEEKISLNIGDYQAYKIQFIDQHRGLWGSSYGTIWIEKNTGLLLKIIHKGPIYKHNSTIVDSNIIDINYDQNNEISGFTIESIIIGFIISILLMNILRARN